MDWDKLRIFHAAAEAGSFTHAGESLRMSQSAVSRQVSSLEKDLRVALFHRHARGLVLTEQGEMLFGTASEILNELAQQDSAIGLARRLRRYVNPSLLVIDEIGYLIHTGRHADLLFEIVSRRHQTKATIVTTNKPFTEWNQVFPNSSCVVALIDRLVHRADVVNIEGESYRLKEAKERTEGSKAKRKSAPRAKGSGIER